MMVGEDDFFIIVVVWEFVSVIGYVVKCWGLFLFDKFFFYFLMRMLDVVIFGCMLDIII